MLHILWRERSSKMSKTSSVLGSLSQMIYDGIHVSNVCTKGNRTLGFLRRNLCACPQEIKEAAYKGLVRPVLEQTGSVWDSSGVGFQNELEKVQNRAVRFVTGNYNLKTIYLSICLYVLTPEEGIRRVPVNQVLGVSFFFCAMLVVLVVSERSQYLPYNAERQAR